MSLNSILKIFQPKDKIFYTLFEQVTETLIEMGTIFHQALHESDLVKRDELLKKLFYLE